MCEKHELKATVGRLGAKSEWSEAVEIHSQATCNRSKISDVDFDKTRSQREEHSGTVEKSRAKLLF